jgi:hypothetical protein
MKSMRKWVAALSAMFALCLVLSGCSLGGVLGGGDPAKNFIGDWKLVGMEDSEQVLSKDDLKSMEDLGLGVGLTFKEDKSFTLNMFGEETSGTWEVKSPTEALLTVEGQTASAKLDGSKLTLEQDDTKLIFEMGTAVVSAPGSGDSDTGKSDTSTSPTSTSDGKSGKTEVAVGTTLADDSICTIEIVNKTTDFADDPGYTLKITNKTDKAITVSGKYGTFSVDGKMVDPLLYETIQPGKYAETFLWFSTSDVANLDALVNVEGTIQIYDSETYDTLAEYPFAM